MGFSVEYVQGLAPGVTDLLVGRRGRTHLLEIKGLGQLLRDSQVAFSRRWRGCMHVATSSTQAYDDLSRCENWVPASPTLNPTR